jgi:hypothetical protein
VLRGADNGAGGYAVRQLGTQSVLMAKTLSQLLRTVLKGDPAALASWFTYLILVCFITTAAFWATRLNKSLQLFPALIIVPLMQVSAPYRPAKVAVQKLQNRTITG